MEKPSLHVAVEHSDMDRFRELLSAGANVDMQDDDGRTPLHVAVEKGYDSTVNALLDLKAGVNIKDNHRNTPLHVALSKDKLGCAIVLLNAGANVDVRGEYGRTPLHIAIEHGCESIVNKILDLKYDASINHKNKRARLDTVETPDNVDVSVNASENMDIVDFHGSTPLHIAAKKGYLNIVKKLLALKADINIQDVLEYSPLHIAVKEKKPDCVVVLLNSGSNVDVHGYNGYTPLHVAAKLGYVGIVEELLVMDADVNRQDNSQRTALHIALMEQNPECADALITASANLDIQDIEGSTPLHIAVKQGYENIVKKLSAQRANANIQNKKQNTALHVALKEKKPVCADALLNACVDVEIKDRIGRTALHIAAGKGYYNIISKLLSLNADVNVQDKTQCTALHLALKEKYPECASALLTAGTNVTMQDGNGRTALHIAAEKGYHNFIKKWLDLKADINIQDRHQHTALLIAVRENRLNCVQVLLNSGADMDIKDGFGSTPLDIAVKCGHKSIWKKLLERKPKLITDNSQLFRLLEHLIWNHRADYIRDLLEARLNLSVQEDTKTTLLHLAAKYECEIVLMKLLEFNLDLNAQEEHGYTPMHIACRYWNLKHVLLLLDAGARWDIGDVSGKTMMWYLIDSVRFRRTLDREIPLLRRIWERTNDGTVVDYTNETSAAEFLLGHPYSREICLEIAQLIILTQKNINMMDHRGCTILNYITGNLGSQQKSCALIRFCIDHGAYLLPRDCNYIVNHAGIRDELLQDVDLCMQSIMNEFNIYTLPRLYEHLGNASFPSMNKLEITPRRGAWRIIEQDMRSEIKRRGYCDVSRLVTTSLTKQCVQSYCNALYRLPRNSIPLRFS